MQTKRSHKGWCDKVRFQSSYGSSILSLRYEIITER
jgi:hypothetical protein